MRRHAIPMALIATAAMFAIFAVFILSKWPASPLERFGRLKEKLIYSSANSTSTHAQLDQALRASTPKQTTNNKPQTQTPTLSNGFRSAGIAAVQIGLQPQKVSVKVEPLCPRAGGGADWHLRVMLHVVVEVLDPKMPCRLHANTAKKAENSGCFFRLYVRGDETIGGEYLKATTTNSVFGHQARPFEYEGYVSLRMPANDVTVEILLDNMMDPLSKMRGIKYDVYYDALLVSDPFYSIPVRSNTTQCNGSITEPASAAHKHEPLAQCSFKDGRNSRWSPNASWVRQSALKKFGLDNTTDAIDTVDSSLVWVPSSCSLRPVTPADFTSFIGDQRRVDIAVFGASRFREAKEATLLPLIHRLDLATFEKVNVHYLDVGPLVPGQYKPLGKYQQYKHLDANDMVEPLKKNMDSWWSQHVGESGKDVGMLILFFSIGIWEDRGFANAVEEFPGYLRKSMQYLTSRAAQTGGFSRLVWITQPGMHLWYKQPNKSSIFGGRFFDAKARNAASTNTGANISERRLLQMNEAGRKIAQELGWRIVDGEGITRARRLACRDTIHYSKDVYEVLMHSMLRAAMEE